MRITNSPLIAIFSEMVTCKYSSEINFALFYFFIFATK